jgi:subtilisin family serine protease
MVQSHGAVVRHEFPEQRFIAIEIHSAHQLAAIERNPNVEYVEQEPMHYALSTDLSASELTPTSSNGLYGLITTMTTNVHNRGFSGTNFKVGIADSGLDYTHPDIAANYVAGYDTFEKDGDPWWNNHPLESHGTHVAGIVLGIRHNGQGIYGAAPQARLYHARVLRADEANGTSTGSSSGIMAGVKWLVSDSAGPKVDLVNMSLGSSAGSLSEQRFYNDCRNKYGAIIVAATGNDGFTSQISYPAGYTVNVAVGAVDSSNAIASFSNRGTNAVDLVGPGVNVISSYPIGEGSDSSVTTTSTFTSYAMEFAGRTNGTTATLVNCGLGQTGEFPASVAGNIALIQRGNISFADKVKNAMDAGAVAAIIYNNAPEDFGGTLGAATTSDGRAWIPAVSVSGVTGSTLVTVVNRATNWEYNNGTSMATPYVTGIAALIWAANPTYTAAAVEDALKKSATDLGAAGYDTTFGYGLVNADAAMIRTGK